MGPERNMLLTDQWFGCIHMKEVYMSSHPYVVIVYGASIECSEKRTVTEQITRYDPITGVPHQKSISSTKDVYPKWIERLFEEREKAFDEDRTDEYEKQPLAVFDESGTELMVGTLLYQKDAMETFSITKLDLSEARKKKTDEALRRMGVPVEDIRILVGFRWW
jgi:hypothetical protein